MNKSQSPYKIVVWATGAIGKYAIKATARHPDMQLVGVRVYSEAKAGKDAGEIAGIGKLGVKATMNPEEIYALEADCVVYAALPLEASLGDILRLLESGKNVVTPIGYSFVKNPDLLAKINTACEKGRSSFHGSGIHPGFCGDRLVLALSAMCFAIDKITVYEIADLSDHDESPELMRSLGFFMSAEEARQTPPMLLPLMSKIFREGMDLVAAGLGFDIDDFQTSHDFALATRDIQAVSGVIKKGHVGGQYFNYRGYSKGHLVMDYRTYWKMSPDALEPNWAFDRTLGYSVQIEGNPGILCSFETVGGRPAELGLVATAANVFNAIPLVIRAAPGMRTALDLPMIVGHNVVSV
jgi:2,4-diaminopentanoate dehydrogenase